MESLVRKVVKEEFKFVREENDIEGLHLTQGDLNEILKHYLITAIWTEEERLKDEMGGSNDDQYDNAEDDDEIEKLIRLHHNIEHKPFQNFVIDDIEPNSRIQAYVDIKNFLKLAGSEAVQEAINTNGLDRLGHDIWLTRNHHGAGFFDHSYQFEKALINAAHKLNEVDLYISDNGQLTFSNAH